MTASSLWLLPGFVATTACSGGPSEWSLDLERELQCGMTVAEVQALTDRRLQPGKWVIPWATHAIMGKYEQPELYLGFLEGKLAVVQVWWEYPLTRVASYPALRVCEKEDPTEPQI